jgi:hypothetical protein
MTPAWNITDAPAEYGAVSLRLSHIFSAVASPAKVTIQCRAIPGFRRYIRWTIVERSEGVQMPSRVSSIALPSQGPMHPVRNMKD